jgi:ABC-type transport system substrate-binding protein
MSFIARGSLRMNLISKNRTAISRGLSIGIVVVLILAAIGAVYYVTLPGPGTTTTPRGTTSTSSTGSTTSGPTSTTSTTSGVSTTGAIPSTINYEWAETYANLDPGITYFSGDYNIVQNIYEPLLYYNYTCSTCVVPWLAQSFAGNAGGTAYTFTLRSGIKFADGEPLNSTSVFFGLNRSLIYDGSTGTSHATQASWEDQQMVNSSLCTFCSGTAQKYGAAYADAWLAKNFVQITGALTFTINVKIPNAAFQYIMTQPLNAPLPPAYVMQKDLALWSQSSNGYTLPNPTLSGSMSNQIKQYLEDLSATCNSGATPSGCARSYLDDSPNGSMASTGPYILVKNDATNNIQTLAANPNYWGGPNKVFPKITNVIFKFVPSQTTREIDLKSAASSGQAMAIDLETTNLYDVANRQQWLGNNKLVSDVPGVSLYGPYPGLSLSFDPFNTNVTSATTG